MLCLTLFGRRLRPVPTHQSGHTRHGRGPEDGKMSEEERKRYIDRALVVKHVIPKTNSSKNEGGNASMEQTLSTGLEIVFDGETPDREKNEGTVQIHFTGLRSSEQRFQRLKSNLIISDPDDLEATRDSSREPWVCAICLIPYDIGDEICWSQNPDCNHVFHHECIEHWLYKHQDCPLCRAVYISFEDEQEGRNDTPDERCIYLENSTTTMAIPARREIFDLENPRSREEVEVTMTESRLRVGDDDDSSVITFGSRRHS